MAVTVLSRDVTMWKFPITVIDYHYYDGFFFSNKKRWCLEWIYFLCICLNSEAASAATTTLKYPQTQALQKCKNYTHYNLLSPCLWPKIFSSACSPVFDFCCCSEWPSYPGNQSHGSHENKHLKWLANCGLSFCILSYLAGPMLLKCY